MTVQPQDDSLSLEFSDIFQVYKYKNILTGETYLLKSYRKHYMWPNNEKWLTIFPVKLIQPTHGFTIDEMIAYPREQIKPNF